eukprot:1097950-Pyramimonas_sp.AAC.1
MSGHNSALGRPFGTIPTPPERSRRGAAAGAPPEARGSSEGQENAQKPQTSNPSSLAFPPEPIPLPNRRP